MPISVEYFCRQVLRLETGVAAAGNVLEIRSLRTHFLTRDGVVPAVDGVSLSVRAGETLALVGESGCGKSITALSVLRLLPAAGRVLAGSRVLFAGRDLLALSEREMRAVRGNELAMIFQEPLTSLNPVFTIGRQIGESLRLHRGLEKRAARENSVELLRRVGMARPDRIVDEYPHALSGGMRQRAMIAMALACGPQLLIADEPTTALDVTVQAQILELLRELRDGSGMAVLLITHNLGVVAEMAEQVAVMYAGQVVEQGDVNAVFDSPSHPYTAGLLRSLPRLDGRVRRLPAIPGVVPHPACLPAGCLFEPRCARAVERCRAERPALAPGPDGRLVSCWNREEFEGHHT
jgi:peptide/nickel transport system ATP-binding protein/oligopeptide transport system ATP-binding protein